MTDKSIFTATRIRGEEKEFLGSVMLSSETDTASEFFRNIIKKDDKDNWKFMEDVPQGYQSKDPVWDGVNYVVTFTNVHDNPGRVDINVQKVWEDGTAAQLIRSIDAFPVHRLVGGIFC